MNGEFNITLSPGQGLAFMEALTGLEPIGNGQVAPKSPHARTCLAAVLGQTDVPLAGDVMQWVNQRNVPGYPARLKNFIKYLRAVGDALEKVIPKEDQT